MGHSFNALIGLSHSHFYYDFYTFVDNGNLTVVFCFGAVFLSF